MLKKLLYLFMGMVFTASVSKAQISSYNFSASTGGAAAYQQISGTALSLSYNGAANADDGTAVVPIGFTFKYIGTNYTNIIGCANGWASFGASIPLNTDTWENDLNGTQVITPGGFTRVPRPILAPLWDDQDNGGGNMQYLTTGVAPLRVFTLQWTNQKWSFSGTAPTVSYQIKLYETSNIIEFIYRQEAGAVVSDQGGATIGIAATGSGANNFQSLSGSGTAPTASLATDVTNIATRPATGQIYRWDPVYCVAGANGLSNEKISNVTVNTINNSSTSTAQYENFTTLVTTLQPTTAYPITTTISSAFASDQVIVYIDYNQNGVFTDAGETVYTSPTGVGPHTGTFTVPAVSASVLLGYTRMRVRMHDVTGTIPNATSCGASSWGQVEDYTVNIQTCTAATGTVTPASQQVCTGTATFTNAGAGTGLTQQWQVSTDGGANFTDIPVGAPYTGTTTGTLTINPVSAGLNNNQYRVRLGGTCTPANTFSNAGTLRTLAPAPTISPAAPVVCLGSAPTALTVTSPSTPGGTPATQTFTQTYATPLTCISPCNTSSPIVVGIPAGAVINNVRVTINMNHTYISDMVINLQAPNGNILTLFNKSGTSGDNLTGTIISSTGVTPFSAGTPPYTGTFMANGLTGLGPTGGVSNVATFPSLYSTPNGTWNLILQDVFVGDEPFLQNWSIAIDYTPAIPQPVIWAPATNLYTDAAGTLAYNGTTPIATIYYKPTAAGNFNYTATYTAAPCTSAPANIPITVNSPVAIAAAGQPVNAVACTIQGTATFTVAATGSGPLAYQWQVDNGTGFADITNGGSYSGATTPTLTLTNIPAGWNGYKYRVRVTGAAPCSPLNSNGLATLTVNPLPTITLSASPYTSLFPGLRTTITASSSPAAATHTWFYNGALITGVTGNSVSGIDVDRLGNYSVRVTDINGCVNTSASLAILDSITSNVFIYPSPNKGQFQVRYHSLRGNQLARSITVYDAKGDKVITQIIPINQPYGRMDVNLKNVGAGIYRVELSDANGRRISTGSVVVLP